MGKILKWLIPLFVASLISTMFPLPPGISPADPTFIGLVVSRSGHIFDLFDNRMIALVVLAGIMTGFDTINAYVTFLTTDLVRNFIVKFNDTIRKLFNPILGTVEQMKFISIAPLAPNPTIFGKVHDLLYGKQFRKEDEVSGMAKIVDKHGFWFIMLFSATPLPFTIGIYAVSAAKYKKHGKFLLAVLIGRAIKYYFFSFASDFVWVLLKKIGSYVGNFRNWNLWSGWPLWAQWTSLLSIIMLGLLNLILTANNVWKLKNSY